MAYAIAPSVSSEPSRFRFTRDAYHQMAALGLFEGKRVELIEGEVIEMSPMSPLHFASGDDLHSLLRRALPKGYWARFQGPLSLGESEPEPDISVVRGSPDDYPDAHPDTALLVVEIADTSLHYDRTDKQSLYAKAGIPEYWIVNLREKQLEVYREPAPDPTARFGYAYQQQQILTPRERVQLTAIPEVSLSVRRILRAALRR